MAEKHVIITAGGSGERMGTSTPKQFLEVKGLPVIMHSINAFLHLDDAKIILVLPKNMLENWEVLCEKYKFDTSHEICMGGETRFDSVKNGLQRVEDNGFVAIHDAVRPVVSHDMVDKCFAEAIKHGNAIPAIRLKDSIRQNVSDKFIAVDRSRFRLIQTPQVFDVNMIKDAFTQSYREEFTDEATVVESSGIGIHFIEGEQTNIKITTPQDLLMVESLLGHIKF